MADLAAVPEEDSEAVALADSAAAEVLAAVVLLVVGRLLRVNNILHLASEKR